MKVKKIGLFVLCSVLFFCMFQHNAHSVEDKGQRIYLSHCSKCHADGVNTVVPSKPITGSAYIATFATFKSYLDKPVGTMPHYSHLITDQKALKDLYIYVKSMDDSSAKEKEKKEKKDKDKTSQSASVSKTKEMKAESSSSSEALSEKKALKMLNEKADTIKVENQKKKPKSKAKKRKWSWWPF